MCVFCVAYDNSIVAYCIVILLYLYHRFHSPLSANIRLNQIYPSYTPISLATYGSRRISSFRHKRENRTATLVVNFNYACADKLTVSIDGGAPYGGNNFSLCCITPRPDFSSPICGAIPRHPSFLRNRVLLQLRNNGIRIEHPSKHCIILTATTSGDLFAFLCAVYHALHSRVVFQSLLRINLLKARVRPAV